MSLVPPWRISMSRVPEEEVASLSPASSPLLGDAPPEQESRPQGDSDVPAGVRAGDRWSSLADAGWSHASSRSGLVPLPEAAAQTSSTRMSTEYGVLPSQAPARPITNEEFMRIYLEPNISQEYVPPPESPLWATGGVAQGAGADGTPPPLEALAPTTVSVEDPAPAGGGAGGGGAGEFERPHWAGENAAPPEPPRSFRAALWAARWRLVATWGEMMLMLTAFALLVLLVSLHHTFIGKSPCLGPRRGLIGPGKQDLLEVML